MFTKKKQNLNSTDAIGKGKKRPSALALIRQKIKISWYVSFITIAAITCVGGLTGHYAITTLNENKLKDTWAILYIEMERASVSVSNTLKANIRDIAEQSPPNKPVHSFELSGKALSATSGAEKKDLSVDDLGYNLRTPDLHQIVSFSGKAYVAKIRTTPAKSGLQSRKYLDLYPVNLSATVGSIAKSKSGRSFIINRSGRVLFASDPKITTESIKKFEILKYFVEANLAVGQTEVTDMDGDDAYAFFQEIPTTNLIFFSEVKRNIALAGVLKAERNYWYTLIAAISAAALLLQIPLLFIKRPLSQLISQMQQLGGGHFNVAMPSSSFGEIQILANSFVGMAKSLLDRNRKIQVLMTENEKRARLEKEILIAKGIQESLLPEGALPRESGLEIHTKYMAADEVAGDWYFYRYNEITDESLIVISDVSGHGAGSSMFTAIIAEIFEDIAERNSNCSFPMSEFAETTNKRLRKFGRGNWHSTVAMLKIKRGSNSIEYMNAGHTPLVIKSPEGKTKLVSVPSNPLGMLDIINIKIIEVPYPSGSIGVLYTDGLTEARNNKNRQFGSKKLVRSIESSNQHQCARLIDSIVTTWRSHISGSTQGDDICIIAFKKVG